MEKEIRTIKVGLPQDIKRGEIVRIDVAGVKRQNYGM